jgi:hypothetical protein
MVGGAPSLLLNEKSRSMMMMMMMIRLGFVNVNETNGRPVNRNKLTRKREQLSGAGGQ